MRFCILAVFVFIASQLAVAEQRFALVIGNSAYDAPGWHLANAANDADLIASTLTDLGFQVTLLKNLREEEMEEAFNNYGKQLGSVSDDAVGVFYFAGHGAQSGGENYLIPVDADISIEQDIWGEAPSLGLLTQHLEAAQNRVNIIILDACRDNLVQRSTRTLRRGLASVEKSRGLLIAFSTAPGATASDGTGINSPYAVALSEQMQVERLPVEIALKRAADAVRLATGERQTPFYNSGLTGNDFCFANCEANPEDITQKVQPTECYVRVFEWDFNGVSGVSFATGEQLCVVEIPPQFEIVSRVRMVESNLDDPDSPAVYETYKEQVLVRDEYTTWMPSSEQGILGYYIGPMSISATDRELTWAEVLVESNITKSKLLEFQSALLEQGYTPEVDGEFGPATLEAMINFQVKRGLEIVGLLTPETMKALGL